MASPALTAAISDEAVEAAGGFCHVQHVTGGIEPQARRYTRSSLICHAGRVGQRRVGTPPHSFRCFLNGGALPSRRFVKSGTRIFQEDGGRFSPPAVSAVVQQSRLGTS
jgi:hypothetical protein